MAYTVAGIVNLALGRIGVKRIAEQTYPFSETSTQAIAANGIWEYIRDEVLETKDWKFAKRRRAIGKLAETPDSGYDYAYRLPDDFLRICRGTENDPGIYPSGQPYKIESIDTVDGVGGIAEFDPAPGYAVGNDVRIGTYARLDFGSSRSLFVCSTYKQDNSTLISVKVTSAVGDTLAVTASGAVITISLANATPANNAANLIQTALRAVATVNSVSVAAWTVTENVAYTASRPTSGVSVGEQPMGDGDKVYDCILIVPASAANSSYFPPINTTYWTEIAPSAKKILLTNYDNVTGAAELVIQYIRRITDVTLYSPSFINALAFRLAAEMAIHLTEGAVKFKSMIELYYIAIAKAEGINQSLDYFDTLDNWREDSAGDSWDKAGRE